MPSNPPRTDCPLPVPPRLPNGGQRRLGGAAMRAGQYRVHAESHAIPMNPLPPSGGACGPIAESLMKVREEQRREACKENSTSSQISAAKGSAKHGEKRRVPLASSANTFARGVCVLKSCSWA